jgi:hypothetical protein
MVRREGIRILIEEGRKAMWKMVATTMILWLVAVSSPASGENPEMKHAQAATSEGPVPEAQVSLNLTSENQAILKETMREHLEALQEIIVAISQGDYKMGAQIAREKLGFAKHHQVR